MNKKLIIGLAVLVVVIIIVSVLIWYFTKAQDTPKDDSKREDHGEETPPHKDITPMTENNGSTQEVPPAALTGAKAFQLGTVPMGPWGGDSKFVDPTAQWIWNTQNAASDAPASVSIKFSNQFYNKTGAPLEAEFHTIVDDMGQVFLNNVKIGDVASGGWQTTNYSKMPMTLKPGNNIIDVIAVNGGGPAAFLGALVKKSDGTVLLKTDDSWVSN